MSKPAKSQKNSQVPLAFFCQTGGIFGDSFPVYIVMPDPYLKEKCETKSKSTSASKNTEELSNQEWKRDKWYIIDDILMVLGFILVVFFLYNMLWNYVKAFLPIQ